MKASPSGTGVKRIIPISNLVRLFNLPERTVASAAHPSDMPAPASAMENIDVRYRLLIPGLQRLNLMIFRMATARRDELVLLKTFMPFNRYLRGRANEAGNRNPRANGNLAHVSV